MRHPCHVRITSDNGSVLFEGIVDQPHMVSVIRQLHALKDREHARKVVKVRRAKERRRILRMQSDDPRMQEL